MRLNQQHRQYINAFPLNLKSTSHQTGTNSTNAEWKWETQVQQHFATSKGCRCLLTISSNVLQILLCALTV